MAKKQILTLTEHTLREMVKEGIDKVLKDESALQANRVSDSRNIINEMARLNKKDDSLSPFPYNKFRIWVRGENSPHKLPHIHISYPQEGWEIKVDIAHGQLWQVVAYGNRGRKDAFSDIIEMVQEWFKMDTQMPGRVGTNREAAMNEWEACNDD